MVSAHVATVALSLEPQCQEAGAPVEGVSSKPKGMKHMSEISSAASQAGYFFGYDISVPGENGGAGGIHRMRIISALPAGENTKVNSE